MRLSKNFSLEEFTKSDTAVQYGIKNDPTPAHIENMRNLCIDLLQPLRDLLGKSIIITSGYRNSALNLRVGGRSNSQHTNGCAVDINAEGMTARELALFVFNSGLLYDQIIFETKGDRQWVHLSYDRKRCRSQVMTCVYRKKIAMYTEGIA